MVIWWWLLVPCYLFVVYAMYYYCAKRDFLFKELDILGLIISFVGPPFWPVFLLIGLGFVFLGGIVSASFVAFEKLEKIKIRFKIRSLRDW